MFGMHLNLYQSVSIKTSVTYKPKGINSQDQTTTFEKQVSMKVVMKLIKIN